jgi:hypothetical protein
MKDCKGTYKVVRVIETEDLLADGLLYEDALAIINNRADDQLATNYRFEIRTEDGGVRRTLQARGKC